MTPQQKKSAVIIGVMAVFMIGTQIWNMSRSDKEEDDGYEQTELNGITVPDPDVEEMDNSKSDAYLKAQGTKNIENYWDACEDIAVQQEDPMKDLSETEDESTDLPRKSSGEVAREITGHSTGAGGNTRATASSPRQQPQQSNPYRESAEEREARHQKRREEALELAGIMAGQDIAATSEDVHDEYMEEDVMSQPSDPDGWGTGISSLDSQPAQGGNGPDHPIKCMFARESKIKSGQRVSVILLEEMSVSGVTIPKNTHMMASCNISGRLELELASLEMGGRIIRLGYEAYDNDGSKGIYCPDVGNTTQTVRRSGTGIIGSVIGGRVGSVARQVVNTGVSIAETAAGEKTVTVPSGYTFFIMKKRNN